MNPIKDRQHFFYLYVVSRMEDSNNIKYHFWKEKV